MLGSGVAGFEGFVEESWQFLIDVEPVSDVLWSQLGNIFVRKVNIMEDCKRLGYLNEFFFPQTEITLIQRPNFLQLYLSIFSLTKRSTSWLICLVGESCVIITILTANLRWVFWSLHSLDEVLTDVDSLTGLLWDSKDAAGFLVYIAHGDIELVHVVLQVLLEPPLQVSHFLMQPFYDGFLLNERPLQFSCFILGHWQFCLQLLNEDRLAANLFI